MILLVGVLMAVVGLFRKDYKLLKWGIVVAVGSILFAVGLVWWAKKAKAAAPASSTGYD